DSTRSQKRIVTTFRASRSGNATRGAPQVAQKRASSPLAAPRRERVAMPRSLRRGSGAGRGTGRRLPPVVAVGEHALLGEVEADRQRARQDRGGAETPQLAPPTGR